MKWFETKKKCGCEADVTVVSTVQTVVRGTYTPGSGQVKARLSFGHRRAQQVRHYRERDDAHFWHWSDREVEKV